MLILIYACTSLNWCSTHSVMVPENQLTAVTCARSQAHVAKWAWFHPEWQVVRWDCKRIEVAEVVR